MVIGFQSNNLTRVRTIFEEHNKKSQYSQVKDVKEIDQENLNEQSRV